MKTTILAFSTAAAMTVSGLSSCGESKKEDAETQQIEAAPEHGNDDTADTGVEDTNEMEEEGVLVGGAMMVPSKNIVENTLRSKDHTMLLMAMKAAGLLETLRGGGPFTVFAPTNAAFEKLPRGTMESLLKPENKTKLTKILAYHVVSGTYESSDLKEGQVLKTIEGEELKITEKDDAWMVNGVRIDIPDVVSTNGVSYVIGKVLMPAKL